MSSHQHSRSYIRTHTHAHTHIEIYKRHIHRQRDRGIGRYGPRRRLTQRKSSRAKMVQVLPYMGPGRRAHCCCCCCCWPRRARRGERYGDPSGAAAGWWWSVTATLPRQCCPASEPVRSYTTPVRSDACLLLHFRGFFFWLAQPSGRARRISQLAV